MISFLLVGVKKKPVSCCVDFLPRWCLTCPLACQVTPCEYDLFTSASDTFFVDTQRWSCSVQFITVCSSNHTLRHLKRCQQMDVVSTQRTKYKNHLTPMGWGGPLSFGRFKSVQHNRNTGHLYSALSDLLISYLPVSCRVAVFEYDFLGWISLLLKKTCTQLLTTHFLTSGPLL